MTLTKADIAQKIADDCGIGRVSLSPFQTRTCVLPHHGKTLNSAISHNLHRISDPCHAASHR